LESTRVPRVDHDFNPRDFGPRHPGSPVPGADPEAAFRSGIGRDHVQDQEAFSTASRAVIEKLRLEKEQMVRMLFKVHTDPFDQHDTQFLSQHLTEEELDQISANAMRNREALNRMNLERDLGEQVPANISREEVQELQRFKININKNLDHLTRPVYNGMDTSKFKSRYSSVANDQTFKPNLMREARRSVVETLAVEDLENSFDFSSNDTLPDTDNIEEISDELFEVDAVKIIADNDKLVSNVAKLCLCDKFSPALIHKADDLVNRKGGDLLSLVTLTESEINFI
jgi:hypothetical protein